MKACQHLYIPDTQIRPGVSTKHIEWVAYYALDKIDPSVDKIIVAGDWYDMHSLSSYDSKGSKGFEGRRLKKDLQAGHDALDILWNIWSARGFMPEVHVTMGNHEERFYRALNENPEYLEGMFTNNDPFEFEAMGWSVHPFLKPVILDGIAYCHFFPHSANGRVTQSRRGAPSARAQIQRVTMSATAGHQQGLDMAIIPTPRGRMRGLIAGSFYLHNESYHRGYDGYWRGVILKHSVKAGDYSLCEVEMSWLKDKYRKYV